MKYKVSNVCQLIDKSILPATQTLSGVTFTNNGDGSITMTGKSTISFSYLPIIPQGSMPLKAGHVYATNGSSGTTYLEIVFVDADGTQHWSNMERIEEGDTFRLGIIRLEAAPETAVTLWPNLFDLTEMYGAGNEPTTLDQFRQDFPETYYEYSPECWKSVRRLKYVAETRNLIDKNTVKVVDGYVWSGGTVLSNSAVDKTLIVPCKPNTVYTVSKNLAVVPRNNDRLAIAESSKEISDIAVGTSVTNIVTNGEPPSSQSLTITTTSTAKNLIITIGCFRDDTSAGTSFDRVLAGVQLEEGSTATSYQPYGYLEMKQGKYMMDKSPVQLLNKNSFYSFSSGGMTFTYNNDGSFTVNGTATGDVWFNLPIFQLLPGGGTHTYLFDVGAKSNDSKVMCNVYFYDDDTSSGVDMLTTGRTETAIIKTMSVVVSGRNVATQARFNITALTGGVANNVTYTPQLFDLTTIYDAGNEPKTVEQFRKDFPEAYYDYALTPYRNLFDISKFSNNAYKSNGVIIQKINEVFNISGKSTNGSTIETVIDCNIPFEVGKTYTFSYSGELRGMDSVFLGARYEDDTTEWNVASAHFNKGAMKRFTPAKAGYFHHLVFWKNPDTNFNGSYNITLQLEEGSIASPYQPYHHISFN